MINLNTERPTPGYLPTDTVDYLSRTGRPLVTVSYAQSLDGCLTLHRHHSSPVSDEASRYITHELRAAHDAILVGIETVLADDPSLTVRLVAGQHPIPVVLDSRLRIPMDARLLRHPRGLIVATLESTEQACRAALEGRGIQIITTTPDPTNRIDLGMLLDQLGLMGISSVMVEGGSEVISSFLRYDLVDRVVVTIAPVFAGGYHVVRNLGIDQWQKLPRIQNVQTLQVGRDTIMWGDVVPCAAV